MALLDSSDATRHPPVVLAQAAVRAWLNSTTVEVQEVGAATIARRRRQIEPAEITVTDRRTIHAPGIDKIIRIGT